MSHKRAEIMASTTAVSRMQPRLPTLPVEDGVTMVPIAEALSRPLEDGR
jgi:hypothetical protein